MCYFFLSKWYKLYVCIIHSLNYHCYVIQCLFRVQKKFEYSVIEFYKHEVSLFFQMMLLKTIEIRLITCQNYNLVAEELCVVRCIVIFSSFSPSLRCSLALKDYFGTINTDSQSSWDCAETLLQRNWLLPDPTNNTHAGCIPRNVITFLYLYLCVTVATQLRCCVAHHNNCLGVYVWAYESFEVILRCFGSLHHRNAVTYLKKIQSIFL